MQVPRGKLEYSDLLSTPDDGKRYELVQGDLYVSPSPSPIHQRVSRRLGRLLEDYFHDRSSHEVFRAPVDLILTEEDVFVPDLLVVGDPRHVSKRGIEGPPLLVVEILSPSTRKIDREVKGRRYGELGVLHYWIVDPGGRTIECHRLEGGRFARVASGGTGDALTHPDFSGLVLELDGIFGGGPLSA